MQDHPRPALLVALLLVIVALCYSSAFAGPFFWDDRFLIVDAPRVVETRPLREYFSQSFFADTGNQPNAYFRPLITLSYRFDYALWKGNPTGFHLTNLLFHLLNTLLVYRLVRARTPEMAALAVTGLWALFPRLTEDVAWISGRTDVLATFFGLLSLCVYRAAHLARRVAAAALLIPALLCKEVALAAAAALLLIELQAADATVSAGSLGKWLARLRRIAPALAALLIYAALRLNFFKLSLPAIDLGAWGRAGTVFEALGRYVYAILNPWQPSVLLGALRERNVPLLLLGVMAAVGLIAAFRFRQHWLERADGPWLALAAVGFALVLHVIPITTVTVAADRFMYLPLVGLLALLAPRLSRWGRLPAVRFVVLGLLIGFGLTTNRRAALYADELHFWLSEHRNAPPTLITTWIELGNLYARLGLFREALLLNERAPAAATGERREMPRFNTAFYLAKLDRTGEAKQRYQELLQQKPADTRYLIALCRVELQELQFAPALERLKALDEKGALAPKERDLLRDAQEFSDLEKRLADPPFAASPEGVYQAARLAMGVERFSQGLRLYSRVIDLQEQPRAVEGLRHIIGLGEPDLVRQAMDRYQARFGPVPPELVQAHKARQAGIAAAIAAKPELGLP